MDSITINTQSGGVADTLKLLHSPGSVFEIRILGARGGLYQHGGFFNDPDKAARAVSQYNNDGRTKGIYCTLNPVNPALLGRYYNRICDHKPELSKADDIVRRRWLLVDFDPERPAGIPTTDEEKRSNHWDMH